MKKVGIISLLAILFIFLISTVVFASGVEIESEHPGTVEPGEEGEIELSISSSIGKILGFVGKVEIDSDSENLIEFTGYSSEENIVDIEKLEKQENPDQPTTFVKDGIFTIATGGVQEGPIVKLKYRISDDAQDGDIITLNINFYDVTAKDETLEDITIDDLEITLEVEDRGTSIVPHLEITTKPTKLEYKAGEIFDPTGMVVKLVDIDGTTTTLDIDDLDYYTDPLTEEDDVILINYATNDGHILSTTLDIRVNPSGNNNNIVNNTNNVNNTTGGNNTTSGNNATNVTKLPNTGSTSMALAISALVALGVFGAVKCIKYRSI